MRKIALTFTPAAREKFGVDFVSQRPLVQVMRSLQSM
jgi:hypothetical protein